MIADWDTDTVIVSDLLQQQHPKIERGLRAILQKHDVPLLRVEGTKDIWIRDYAPLQIKRGQFIQFRYYPDYLRDSVVPRRISRALRARSKCRKKPGSSKIAF